MADVVVFGTAAADIMLRVPSVPAPGGHVMARPLGWRLGGGSVNLACALASHGHRVELVGPFGSDAVGAAMRAELTERGVGTRWSYRLDAPSPRALILLDDQGERSIVGIDAGSVTDAYPLAAVPDIETPDCIFVESYLRFPATLADAHPGTLLVATPPDRGVRTWPADILVGSERLFEPGWARDPYAEARAVAGPRLRFVVVTRGAAGAEAFRQDGSIFVPARAARQVDATGAGDAFAAGLIAALLDGNAMREAMTIAVDCGAAAVEVLRSVPRDWLEGAP